MMTLDDDDESIGEEHLHSDLILFSFGRFLKPWAYFGGMELYFDDIDVSPRSLQVQSTELLDGF